MMKRSQTLIFIMILFTINSCVQSSKLKENTYATKNKKEIEEKNLKSLIMENIPEFVDYIKNKK